MQKNWQLQSTCLGVFLSNGPTCVKIRLGGWGGGEGLRDSFKINHKTLLRKRMSIAYLKPFVMDRMLPVKGGGVKTLL